MSGVRTTAELGAKLTMISHCVHGFILAIKWILWGRTVLPLNMMGNTLQIPAEDVTPTQFRDKISKASRLSGEAINILVAS
jgi:hypothetical protein